jgi:hypothetical protein
MGIPSRPKEIRARGGFNLQRVLHVEYSPRPNFYGKGETRRGSIGIEY